MRARKIVGHRGELEDTLAHAAHMFGVERGIPALEALFVVVVAEIEARARAVKVPLVHAKPEKRATLPKRKGAPKAAVPKPHEPPWRFPEPRDTLVFTSRAIRTGRDFIHYVLHDIDDGAWQLLPTGGLASERDAVLVSLGEMASRDPSLRELADLPRGFCAWREEPKAPWHRAELPH